MRRWEFVICFVTLSWRTRSFRKGRSTEFFEVKPLVSILIPAYNAAPLLAQTLKTAVEQTWLAKEIILVDDGSSDDTVAVARQFGSKVQIFSQPNQGAAAARN